MCVCVCALVRGYLLNMTSQAWLDKSLVDRVVWTHQLVVVIPDNIRYNGTALMYITGGGNNNPGPPAADDEDLLCTAIIAMANGVIGATLYQIPNAPIVFTEDPQVHAAGGDGCRGRRAWSVCTALVH